MRCTAYIWGSAPKEMAAGGNDTATATTANTNSSTVILPATDTTGKRRAILTARLALMGHVLTPSNTAHGVGTCYVTRWRVEKVLPDLDAVQAFLNQIGGLTHV